MSGKAARKRKRAERREQEYSGPVRLARRVRRLPSPWLAIPIAAFVARRWRAIRLRRPNP